MQQEQLGMWMTWEYKTVGMWMTWEYKTVGDVDDLGV